MKNLVVLLLLFSAQVLATMPAEQIPITDNHARKYSFLIEIVKSKEETQLTFTAPPTVEFNWHLVGTQVYSFQGHENGMLTKNSVSQSEESTKISIYYNHTKHDVFVGVYYECRESNNHYCGANKERLYLIESVNSY